MSTSIIIWFDSPFLWRPFDDLLRSRAPGLPVCHTLAAVARFNSEVEEGKRKPLCHKGAVPFDRTLASVMARSNGGEARARKENANYPQSEKSREEKGKGREGGRDLLHDIKSI